MCCNDFCLQRPGFEPRPPACETNALPLHHRCGPRRRNTALSAVLGCVFVYDDDGAMVCRVAKTKSKNGRGSDQASCQSTVIIAPQTQNQMAQCCYDELLAYELVSEKQKKLGNDHFIGTFGLKSLTFDILGTHGYFIRYTSFMKDSLVTRIRNCYWPT